MWRRIHLSSVKKWVFKGWKSGYETGIRGCQTTVFRCWFRISIFGAPGLPRLPERKKRPSEKRFRVERESNNSLVKSREDNQSGKVDIARKVRRANRSLKLVGQRVLFPRGQRLWWSDKQRNEKTGSSRTAVKCPYWFLSSTQQKKWAMLLHAEVSI